LLWLVALCLAFCAPKASAQSISGYVFEDQGYTGGAGRPWATAGTASGVNGARVELYTNGGNYVCYTTTATGGTPTAYPGYYIFNTADCAGIADTNKTYTVRVVNDTVVSNYTGYVNTLIPVQTFGTCLTVCETTGTAVTNYVGGLHPTLVDPGNGAAGAGVPANSQSLAIVELTAGNPTATGVNFGFNFFTIVNVNASGQGSLNQFIANANALTGNAAPKSIFMIYNGAETTGMNTTYTNLLTTLNGGTYKGFVINMGGAAPTAFTASGGTIDASTEVTNLGGTNPNTATLGSNSQCGATATGTKVGVGATVLPAWTGITLPVVEIQNCADGQWNLNGANETVNAMAFHQCTLLINNSGTTVSNNLVGMHADGTISTIEAANFGIDVAGATLGGRTINHNYVRVNNSAIRNDAHGSTGDLYEYNEVTSPYPTAQTNTFDGILLIGPATYSGDLVEYNYSHDLAGGGIEIGFGGSGTMTNETITQNTVCSNGWYQNQQSPPYTYSNASTEAVNIAIWGLNQGNTVTISKNVITNSSGVGILVENAYGFTISQNSIYQNGGTAAANYYGLGIALFPTCTTCDPNNFSTTWTQTVGPGNFNGVMANVGTESTTAPNYQMNYPVMTMATYTAAGGLRVKGYVGGSTNLAISNAIIEIFVAYNDNNQNGNIFAGDGLMVPHGEGQTFVETFSANAQGLFDVTIPASSLPSGVTITAGTTSLTSTATAAVGSLGAGSTSEFGPNILVETSANSIQGYVYYDANHDGAMDNGESWQYGATVYAVLWDTTCNIQAAVGATKATSCTPGAGTAIPAQTIAFGASTDTGFFSFDNVTPGTAATPEVYEVLLTTTAPATGGIYSSLPAVTIPAGWMMTNPNTASASFSTIPTTPQIIVQNFGLFHGVKVSGETFKDNGAGTGGVANDGHLNGTEPGLANVVLTAKDGSSVTLDTETSGANGTYTLWLPAVDSSQNTVGAVTVALTQTGGYTATGFDAGTPATGGTYSTTTLVFSFTPTWTSTYTGLNFGFIQSGNIFAPNGQQTTVPGSFANYAHQYTSITGGTVTFTETVAQSQPNYFTEILYNDPTCTGTLAGLSSLAWGSTVTIPAGGGKTCIIVKENVSAAASFGMSNAATITASFSYGAGSSVAATTLTVVDITTLDTKTSGDLQLVKSSYIDNGCTNPASPTYLTTPQSAQSGYCVKYQIQATNTGASAISGLTINDSAPPYTTLQTGTPAATVGTTGCTGLTVGTVTSTNPGVSASFTGSMPAGCVATFVYEVKLN
jgi:parallel beta-helix repeat protein